jgi:thiol-disulfide isomerase/thioredoxin
MSAVMLGLRVLLAAVFAVAAAGKLADRPGTRAAAESFGAPRGLSRALAAALPLAELSAAGLLLMPSTTRAGALVALALLVVFSVAIAVNLALGRRPDCHCFGQVHSEPVGAATLVRNAALIAVAACVLIIGWSRPGPSAVAWVDALAPGSFAAGVAVAVAPAIWLAYSLLRRHGRLLRRVDALEAALQRAGVEPASAVEPEPVGLPIGTRAPAFPGLAELLKPGRPLVLLFTSVGCGPCRALEPTVAGWRDRHGDLLSFAELSFDEQGGVARSFEVEGTPAAVVIAPDGSVASAVAHGSDGVEALFDRALVENQPPPPSVGDRLPPIELPMLGAAPAALTAHLAEDRDTLLLFWNPGCGYCRSMRDDIGKLEAAAPEAPALVVVSAGDEDAVRDESFSGPVFLDADYTVAMALGAGGTPMALRVGPDTTLRAEIAVGADAVLELAGRAPTLHVVQAS